MDRARGVGNSEILDHVDDGVDEDLNQLVERNATDAGVRRSLDDKVSVSGEGGTSEEMCNDLKLNEELKKEPQEVKGQDMGDPQEINDTLHGVDQGASSSSRKLVNGEVLETCVVIDSSAQVEYFNGDNWKLEAEANESGLSKMSMKAPKGVSETDKNSCVIDINCGGSDEFSGNLEGEMICRICHLASGQSLDVAAVGTENSATTDADLIQLGCACKDELGIAHSHCAEAWFKLRGNRLCEICGETAKNVSEITDSGFIEEWNENRFMDSDNTSSSRFGGCWRGQPFCNFLMACLVIAFVLPWFFRVNILVGQDTRLSPERPGFKSRQRKFFGFLFTISSIPSLLLHPSKFSSIMSDYSTAKCYWSFACVTWSRSPVIWFWTFVTLRFLSCRGIITATITSDPVKCSEAFLGKPSSEYCNWILHSHK
ncbi:hypothetical protein VNO77_01152 [Canavalia gladiata]|uniref:RING-CH-type domain-containing protein n=1 Tax=Canavalia gladiata TaxID=3824 RepID=A0AAN9MRD5_CANGL